ncbi:hypothetical protein LOC51_19900 [Rubrivivax sp. JA1024]|nr:hypothetical protein [Rubrivivax sp. JA1024]
MIFNKYLRGFIREAEGAGGGAAGGGAAGGAAGGGQQGAPAGGAAAAGGGASPQGGASVAGSGGDQGWWRGESYSGLDADTTKFLDGKNYPDIKTALSSLRSADQMARDRNVIKKPDPANMQQWEGFAELGWSPDIGNYKLTPPAAGEGEVHDEKAWEAFLPAAHEARLLPWQAEAVYTAMHKHDNAIISDFKAAAQQANADLDRALRSKFGNQYDAKVDLAKRAFSAFAPSEAVAGEMDKMLGSAGMVDLFIKIGEAMGEDRLVTGKGGDNGSQSPAQARAERLRLEADKDFLKILNDPRHPQSKDYAARRQRLIEIEAGGGRR